MAEPVPPLPLCLLQSQNPHLLSQSPFQNPLTTTTNPQPPSITTQFQSRPCLPLLCLSQSPPHQLPIHSTKLHKSPTTKSKQPVALVNPPALISTPFQPYDHHHFTLTQINPITISSPPSSPSLEPASSIAVADPCSNPDRRCCYPPFRRRRHKLPPKSIHSNSAPPSSHGVSLLSASSSLLCSAPHNLVADRNPPNPATPLHRPGALCPLPVLATCRAGVPLFPIRRCLLTVHIELCSISLTERTLSLF
ncbi:hypothetical protein M0R45_006546 [Rubus argutus]|uniref:Uncharacterized protein n=1 Tax=Rubus argutus TaxID=59490 RepID=A0AAW1YRH7_RUBAR